jgi:hypothetical protein
MPCPQQCCSASEQLSSLGFLEPARAIRHRAGARHRVAHLLHAHRKRGVRHRAARASRLADAGAVRGWASCGGGGEEVPANKPDKKSTD